MNPQQHGYERADNWRISSGLTALGIAHRLDDHGNPRPEGLGFEEG